MYEKMFYLQKIYVRYDILYAALLRKICGKPLIKVKSYPDTEKTQRIAIKVFLDKILILSVKIKSCQLTNLRPNTQRRPSKKG